ncbi:iron-sulfur cluster-binding domain-containing protein [Streptomyces sp. HNM0663]|uniref:Iron-sulfur cluster-binding domain-containing protein n=1 Tax=Streptomyces chengmaiensis TaxID=3040919 RepID=A0ABT6HJN1_9ACTN|nr:iron-sulfur cluster-binding domain-containing protein [Streptomyces chengmaiensis]MDH2388510.1 iron-sulfur cluster-binding domain-containing protein [Streptomyces chengmaiensis]
MTIRLRPNGSWNGFEAGQYVHFGVDVNGVLMQRLFSLASSAHDTAQVEITVASHPAGIVSSYLREHARPGMVMTMSQAGGVFTLPHSRPQRLLLISGGSGITPVMSMLRTLCHENHAGRITFLHYAKSAQRIVYGDELADLSRRYPNIEVFTVLPTREQGGDLHGSFGIGHLLEVASDFCTSPTYLCSGPRLRQAVSDLWAQRGIGHLLHTELFVSGTTGPVSRGGDVAAGPGVLRFSRSAVAVPAREGTLLEQAEAAGADPRSGCRMGICHTCTTRKISGSVRNLLTDAVSDGRDESIQLCVSVPHGDVLLDL